MVVVFLRLAKAFGAAVSAGLIVLLIYVVVDLYMSGHGKGWTPERGDPWYYHLFTGLIFISGITAGVLAYRRR